MVSHDRYFLNKLFPRTAWLEDGVITNFEGSYHWARAKWQEIQNRKEPEITEVSLIPKIKEVKDIKPVTLEEEIARLERTVTSLKQDAESEADRVKFKAFIIEIAATEEKLASFYDIWMDEME